MPVQYSTRTEHFSEGSRATRTADQQFIVTNSRTKQRTNIPLGQFRRSHSLLKIHFFGGMQPCSLLHKIFENMSANSNLICCNGALFNTVTYARILGLRKSQTTSPTARLHQIQSYGTHYTVDYTECISPKNKSRDNVKIVTRRS